MNGNVALDTSVAVRFLNGEKAIVAHVLALPTVILPTVVIGELLFGAENSSGKNHIHRKGLALLNPYI